MSPNVVGLDLSLTGSGIASSLGWCCSVGITGITSKPLMRRVELVDALVSEIMTQIGKPDLIVVEVPAFSRSGGGALERAALWWTVVARLVRSETPVAEAFNQSRMRYATGKGRADKSAIVDAVARRWPSYVTGGDDNLCDAVVLAAMGADHLGSPLAEMPQTHRAALGTVRWPEVTA